jgi:hypothetical protein
MSDKLNDKCFACNRPILARPCLVQVKDESQTAYVGPDCYKKIKAAGAAGYQPPLGGPRLVLVKET